MPPAKVLSARVYSGRGHAPRLGPVPDAFEQELLTDIAAADAVGEYELAAEWGLELRSYRAAKAQAHPDDVVWEGTSTDVRRQALDGRRTDLP